MENKSKNFDLELVNFIQNHPTNFHVVDGQAKELIKNGYTQLCETEQWNLEAGGKYFVVRNDSSICAFQIPEKEFKGFHIMASHSDSPCFKIKENPEIDVEKKYKKLNVELYGGALLAPWFDRPLSIAGRLFYKDSDKINSILVDMAQPLVLIPNLAIHMNREANKGYEYNVQKDLLPLYSLEDSEKLLDKVAKKAVIEPDSILGFDLFCYNCQAPSFWGASKEFLSSPRLDDVQCAFSSLNAFLESSPKNYMPIHVVFDNEEVGSSTRQGAASTFLKDTITRISEALGLSNSDLLIKLASSFMLSADNAHALHPNYPEKCDPVNKPVLGGGVVVKFSANQKYTTDGFSSAYLRSLAKKANVPMQVFVNRSDIPGGSTLGNISGNQVAVATADIGIAQLAMHSPYETCGVGDTEQMIKLAKTFFED